MPSERRTEAHDAAPAAVRPVVAQQPPGGDPMSSPPLAAPGPRPGALTAPGLDPRPCVTNPPQWWDTGNPNNPRAIKLCGTCPLRAQAKCKTEDADPRGVIRAGTAYDSRGNALTCCRKCGQPLPKWAGRRATTCTRCPRRLVAEQHDLIATLRELRTSWAQIGRITGHKPDAVRAYWDRYQARQAHEQAVA